MKRLSLFVALLALAGCARADLAAVPADPNYAPLVKAVMGVDACMHDPYIYKLDPSKCEAGLAAIAAKTTPTCSATCAAELFQARRGWARGGWGAVGLRRGMCPGYKASKHMSPACISGVFNKLSADPTIAGPAQAFFKACQAYAGAAVAPAPSGAHAPGWAPAPAPVQAPPGPPGPPGPSGAVTKASTSGAFSAGPSALLLAAIAAACLLF
eukprot:scaffold4.g4830.t1